MKSLEELLREFEQTMEEFIQRGFTADSALSPNPELILHIQDQLIPFAERGNVFAQLYVAAIYLQGLTCKSQVQFLEQSETLKKKATHWLVAAAKQGYWPAIDNMIASGIGPEAERAQQGLVELERKRPDLIGRSNSMPVYGPEFMNALCLKLYGKVYSFEKGGGRGN